MLQLLEIENIRFVCVRPPQKCCKVDQCRGEYPLLVPKRRQIDIRISLAELLTFLVDEKRDMTKLRGLPFEGVVQGDVHRSRGHPFLDSQRCPEPLEKTYCASDNVGNLHAMVIDHVGKMIGRMPVRLEQDWIIIDTIYHIQLTVRAIVTGFSINQVIIHGIPVDL